ncbi:MAG: response regulator [Candidatus Schekmanbacteria bacterium]|nr:response regulator [Candidatus Schekmanbacteria bacterium]
MVTEGKRILLLEDEPFSAWATQRYLTIRGFRTETAATVDEALRVAATFRPDVLVADWLLSEARSGLDAARQIRELQPEVKVIFLTGVTSAILTGEGGQHELAGYRVLAKPCEPSVLVQRIVELTAPENKRQSD